MWSAVDCWGGKRMVQYKGKLTTNSTNNRETPQEKY